MTRSLTPMRAALVALALAAAVAGLAGCAKKVTSVDASFVVPEGTSSPQAQMLVTPDVPTQVSVFTDNPPDGPDPTDTFDHYELVHATIPGAVAGIILDGTPASTYQVLRKEANGGLHTLDDFLRPPTRRWLDSQWEAYTFDDPRPSGYQPPSYQGRGVIAGVVTRSCPITNMGQAADTAIADIPYAGNPLDPADFYRFPTDSLFPMSWSPVPGAVGYWVQVYQLRGDIHSDDEVILSGVPAPLYTGKTHDLFVGFVAAPTTSYKLGTPGALVLTRRTTINGQTYLVRVSAVNDAGQLIAYTHGATGQFLYPGFYKRFPMGAVQVKPRRAHLGPAPVPRGDPGGAFGISGLQIIPER